MLRYKYKFPVDQSAIYYLFDRDPKSNTDTELIKNYIQSLANPYENKNYKAGQLILSYPSIESYIVSNFRDTSNLRFSLGKEAKAYNGYPVEQDFRGNSDVCCGGVPEIP